MVWLHVEFMGMGSPLSADLKFIKEREVVEGESFAPRNLCCAQLVIAAGSRRCELRFHIPQSDRPNRAGDQGRLQDSVSVVSHRWCLTVALVRVP